MKRFEEWVDRYIDFLMRWVIGLPVEIGPRVNNAWLRLPIFVVAFVWIPVVFFLCMPLFIPWMLAAMIVGMWEMMTPEIRGPKC